MAVLLWLMCSIFALLVMASCNMIDTNKKPKSSVGWVVVAIFFGPYALAAIILFVLIYGLAVLLSPRQ